MKGMQYTFAVAPPPSSSSSQKSKTTTPAPLASALEHSEDHHMAPGDYNDMSTPTASPNVTNDHVPPHQVQLPASPVDSNVSLPQEESIPSHAFGFSSVVRFPALFASDFSPNALLAEGNSRHHHYNQGDIHMSMALDSEGDMDVPRPTFEFPLDDLMDSPPAEDSGRSMEDGGENMTVVAAQQPAPASAALGSGIDIETPIDLEPASNPAPRVAPSSESHLEAATLLPVTATPSRKPDLPKLSMPDNELDPSLFSPGATTTDASPPPPSSTFVSTPTPPSTTRGRPRSSSKHHRDDDTFVPPPSATMRRHTHSASVPSVATPVLIDGPLAVTAATPTRRNSLKTARYAVPSATPPPRAQRPSHGTGGFSGGKSECANCGATSTPLWRRGLNDELNCNVRVDSTPYDLPVSIPRYSLVDPFSFYLCSIGLWLIRQAG